MMVTSILLNFRQEINISFLAPFKLILGDDWDMIYNPFDLEEIMITKIDHIAIAVKNLDAEIKKYKEVLGFHFLGTEVVEEQKVRVAKFDISGVHIELLEPTADDSPISAFLEKRGGGIHHISYQVDDINRQIKELEDNNIMMLNDKPRKGSDNAWIAFAHPKCFSGVLVELTQEGV
jgi:methylmalonyl-CoA/ethylmalonyl-CoA epimerase